VPYSANQYRADLVMALLMALGFTFIAAIPLGILGIVNLVASIRHRPLELPWPTYLAVVLVVPASYVAAALSGGTAAFLLRPLRGHLIGWMLSGAVVSACIYGSVGLALAVFFNPVGAAILENSTRQEAWNSILPLVALLSPVGALVGGYFWWRDRQGKPVW
jgi:hypothetical protein